MLHRRPSEPLPRSEHLFWYTPTDIRVSLLANPEEDPFDLLMLESRQDLGEGRDKALAPASGGDQFFDRKA